MSSSAQQIKERLSIVDVVSSYIKLEKAGRNFKARCPFHNEKTPSFFVSPERDTYHCFGCSVGGDIFSFVETIEGVAFKEALNILGDRAGVHIHAQSSEEQSVKERLLELLEEATSHYETLFSHTPEVSKYLVSRGLTENTISDFRIGYVTNTWRTIFEALQKKGFSKEELVGAGLVVRHEKGYYDRFRGRIMFPITDALGRVVAFSGRVFGESDVAGGKYINSPETILYNKSKVLYGFDKAKIDIRRTNTCIVVEGQMDVIMSHQAGAKNTIALSGTALSVEHLALVSRLGDELVLAFDADKAGIAASGRSIATALSHGFNVRLVKLSPGVDPADFILKDKEAWLSVVKDSKHVIDFYLQVLKDKNYDIRTLRSEVQGVVLPYIAALPGKIEQAHFVGEVARILSLSEEPIWEELKRREKEIMRGDHASTPSRDKNKKIECATPDKKERNLEERAAGLIEWLTQKKETQKNIEKIRNTFEETTGKDVETVCRSAENNLLNSVSFEAERHIYTKERVKEELKEIMTRLKEYHLRVQLRKATNDLHYAENKGDNNLVKEKLEECSILSKKLQGVMMQKK